MTARIGFAALGSRCVIATVRREQLDRLLPIAIDEIDLLDRTASRLRQDSELMQLCMHNDGSWMAVSGPLWSILTTAAAVAEATKGIVVPTVERSGAFPDAAVGGAHDNVFTSNQSPSCVQWMVAGKQLFSFDRDQRKVMFPKGVIIDVDVIAKSLWVDRLCARLTVESNCAVLVDIGGDIACSHRHDHPGWSIGVSNGSSLQAYAEDSMLLVMEGGVATATPQHGEGRKYGLTLNPVLDSAFGPRKSTDISSVTVVAASCIGAKAAVASSITLGKDARAWLMEQHLPARVVLSDGTVEPIGAWPLQRTDHFGEVS